MMKSNGTIEAIVRAISEGRTDEAQAGASALESALVPILFERFDHPVAHSADPEDPRRIIETVHVVAHAAARKHPDAFISSLRSGTIFRNFLTLSVLAALRRSDGVDILVDALNSPSWLVRNEGIRGLDQLGAGEALKPHWARLLDDNDGSVAFSALRAMIRWGEPDDIPRLQAFRATASRGACELALDAIEAICGQASLPLPEDHLGPRLETVQLTLGGVARVTDTSALVSPPQQVRAGQALARLTSADGAEWEIEAPCDGIVVRLDLDLAQAVIERRLPATPALRSR